MNGDTVLGVPLPLFKKKKKKRACQREWDAIDKPSNRIDQACYMSLTTLSSTNYGAK